MNKLKTVVIFLCLISLIHNSFLMRLSILIAERPNLISYGTFFIVTVLVVFISFYSRRNSLYLNKFLFSFLLSIFMSIIFQINTTTNYGGYSIFDAIILRFPFLILFFLVFPLRIIDLDYLLFKRLITLYLFMNLFLGILQVAFNQPIVSVDYNQEPFVNTVFFKDGFSTNYSYILNYGGKVRAFALFDSGLSFGLIMLFLIIVLVFKSKNKFSIFNIFVFFLAFVGLFFSYTRNVYVVTIFYALLLFIYSINRNILSTLFFKIEIFIQIIITIVSSSLFTNQFLSKIKFVDTSTLVSRGQLFQQALSQIENPYDFLFGIGVQNVGTIDNDILYLIYYGGIFTYIGVLFIYIHIMNICLRKKNKRMIDYAVSFFIMTYPIAGLVNFVSNIYLVICMFYYLYNESYLFYQEESVEL